MFPISPKISDLSSGWFEIACSIIGSTSSHCFHYVHTLCKQGDLYFSLYCLFRERPNVSGAQCADSTSKRLGFILGPFIYASIIGWTRWSVLTCWGDQATPKWRKEQHRTNHIRGSSERYEPLGIVVALHKTRKRKPPISPKSNLYTYRSIYILLALYEFMNRK